MTIQRRTDRAKIFFTVDGSEPTRGSLPYDAPVRIDPGTTLKARAFLQGWDDSKVTVGSYPHPDQLPAPAPDTRPAAPATAPASGLRSGP